MQLMMNEEKTEIFKFNYHHFLVTPSKDKMFPIKPINN